jgi:hypothetical protein
VLCLRVAVHVKQSNETNDYRESTMGTVRERINPPHISMHAGHSLGRLVKVARNSIGLALLAASAAGFAQTGASAVPEAQLTACPFAKGDSITKVKAFYALQVEPTRFPNNAGLAGATAYQYHLPDRGVWIFFDSSLQVASLRFEPPFAGPIGGIAPGATLEELKRIKGEPTRPAFQGFLDAEETARRKDLPKQRVAELTDMVPRAKVAELVDELVKLYTSPLKWTQAYVYGSAQSGTFNRYDVGGNNKVQLILSSSCAAS